MKHTYHVLTAFSRYENLTKLCAMLEPQGVQWHIITDAALPFRITPTVLWIHAYEYRATEGIFYAVCNSKLNWFLDTYRPVSKDRYCFLNDDDAYEPGFFEKLDVVDGDVLIASMDRGHQTPPGVEPIRAHGVGHLIADPSQMHPGLVGVEQIVMAGRVLEHVRLPILSDGDGRMVEWVVQNHGAQYVPDAVVQFNRYEPGRWNL